MGMILTTSTVNYVAVVLTPYLDNEAIIFSVLFDRPLNNSD